MGMILFPSIVRSPVGSWECSGFRISQDESGVWWANYKWFDRELEKLGPFATYALALAAVPIKTRELNAR